MRQFGRKQLIPDSDMVTPSERSLLSGTALTWERHWASRPMRTVTPLKEEDALVSRHYLVWMRSDSSVRRSEARSAERAELGTLSACSTSRPPSTVSVRDRLGPRRAPVWDRLGRLPSVRLDGGEKGKGPRRKVMKKKWVPKKRMEMIESSRSNDVEMEDPRET